MADTAKKPRSFMTEQSLGAATDLLQEMFQDFHRNRRQIYVLNFYRGIFFGVGSAIGGTLVVAIIVWLLSLLHHTWLGPVVQAVQQAAGGR